MKTAPQSVKEPASVGKPALKIWRYDVPNAAEVASAPEVARGLGFMLTMPRCAQIVWVGRQFQTARIWALVNPAMAQETRYFWVTETNHALPSTEEFAAELKVEVRGLKHLGTWMEMGDRFTKHLLEVVVERESPR